MKRQHPFKPTSALTNKGARVSRRLIVAPGALIDPRQLWVTVLLVVSLASMPGQAAPSDVAQKHFERGNEFFRKESFPRAKAEYLRALKADAGFLDARYNLAVVCEQLNQLEDAAGHYRLYLEKRPRDADVWTQLGVLSDQRGDKQGARAAYEKALEIDPDFGRAHHNLGVLFKEAGEMSQAENHLRRYVTLEEAAGKRNGDAYYSLGVLYLKQIRAEDAKLMIQKAVETDPSRPLYNNAMGDVYLLGNQTELAELHFRKAIEKDDRYPLAYSGLGDTLARQDKIVEAAESYHKALELNPAYSIVHYKLGRLYEETEPATAIKQFEKYLESGKDEVIRNEATARLGVLKALQ